MRLLGFFQNTGSNCPANHQKQRVRLVLSTLLAMSFIVSAPPISKAVTLQPMSIAYEGIVSGNFATTGNSVLTCSTSAGAYASQCIDARKRSGSRLNNDDYSMINFKVPFGQLAEANYFNASSGSIVIPAGAVIKHATLFWGGSMRLNTGDVGAVNPSAKGSVLFSRPGDDCSGFGNPCAVTAIASDIAQINPTSNLGPYRASSDVTAKLTDSSLSWTINGPHKSLNVSVANIQTTTGRDKAAGWGVIVVYEDPSEAPHQIRILKGLAQESLVEDDEFIFDGFQTAAAGNVLTDFGMIAFDGDASNATDSISMIDAGGSAIIADGVNPDNNIANSTISMGGIISPYLNNSSVDRSKNTFGVDVDQISMVNGLSHDVVSAKLWPSVSGDSFYITGLALSNEITSPDVHLTKYVSSITGGDPDLVESGDTITYTITAENSGQANASTLEVRDVLPADLDVTGSTGIDCVVIPSGEICKNIGTLNAGAEISFTITGTLNGTSIATTGAFDNRVTAEFESTLGPQTAVSEVVTVEYGITTADLAAGVSWSRDYIQAGQSTTITGSVTNLGPASDSNPSLELTAQEGALLTVANIPSGCTKTAPTTLTCGASALGISQANALEPGMTASVSFIVTPAKSTSSMQVWATTKTSVAAGDPNPDNDTAETMLYVNHKPKAKDGKATAKTGGSAIQISLATKISDSDGDALHVRLGRVKHGKATVNGDIITFTPPKKWHGTFKLRYYLTDGKGGTAKAWITIKVVKQGRGYTGNRCLVTGC